MCCGAGRADVSTFRYQLVDGLSLGSSFLPFVMSIVNCLRHTIYGVRRTSHAHKTSCSRCPQVRRHVHGHRVYAAGPPGTETFHHQLQQQRATIEGQNFELARLRQEVTNLKRYDRRGTWHCSLIVVMECQAQCRASLAVR